MEYFKFFSEMQGRRCIDRKTGEQVGRDEVYFTIRESETDIYDLMIGNKHPLFEVVDSTTSKEIKIEYQNVIRVRSTTSW